MYTCMVACIYEICMCNCMYLSDLQVFDRPASALCSGPAPA